MKNQTHVQKGHNKHYQKLLLMAVLSFIAMYCLMYTMVDSFENVLPNVNQFFMAGLMTSPMIIIELLVMGAMYMNKKLNVIIIAISFIALIAFFMFIRQQASVSDKQFLKSMIPHHGAAILMSEKASITDPEIRQLASKIIADQRAEIEQMKAKLNQLGK